MVNGMFRFMLFGSHDLSKNFLLWVGNLHIMISLIFARLTNLKVSNTCTSFFFILTLKKFKFNVSIRNKGYEIFIEFK